MIIGLGFMLMPVLVRPPQTIESPPGSDPARPHWSHRWRPKILLEHRRAFGIDTKACQWGSGLGDILGFPVHGQFDAHARRRLLLAYGTGCATGEPGYRAAKASNQRLRAEQRRGVADRREL